MALSNLARTARFCAVSLMNEGGRTKRWTPEMKNNWTRAFNALQRLSGHKIRKTARKIK